jgi:hydroxypyruvate isomerase
VLNKDENADLTKLFNMVNSEKSQKKMLNTQEQMLKIIDSITTGMQANSKSGAGNDFKSAYAGLRTNMNLNYNPTQNAGSPLKAGQANQDALKAAMSASVSNQSALLGNIPKLEIDKEAAAQIGQTFKEGMGDEFKSAVANINRLAEQLQNRGDAGLQQQMVGLLEDMRRSMQATATASERLAQVASN